MDTKKEKALSVDDLEEKIQKKNFELLDFCKKNGEDCDVTFFSFEKLFMTQIFQLACLYIQYFVVIRHDVLDYTHWLEKGTCYLKKKPVFRTIKTLFGPVRIYRKYLECKKGGVIYPLDISLGLTKDGFSPMVMSLVVKLSTRVSYATAVIIFKCFCRWAPSTEAIEHLVLGLGAEASEYMENYSYDQTNGDEILVIEVDGKATPTATDDELKKRRKKRSKKDKGCCQRHRGKGKRKLNKRKRRKKGCKSKNGRSITIVVMYTLKRGDDGLLHGPYNKIVWASYAPRRVMLEWARKHATKRGFPPETQKTIHIAIDGEVCLMKGLSKLFPNASFVLDIRHLEEKIWKVGRLFYKEGSKELEEWVEEMKKMIYQGKIKKLLKTLKEKETKLSKRAKRDKEKIEGLRQLINYIEKRVNMMDYKNYIEKDLPIATGIVEGAVRYVIGERLDCSGMRWIPGRAEAVLQLRCIELNGNWDEFFNWGYEKWLVKLKENKKVQVRTNETLDISDVSDNQQIL